MPRTRWLVTAIVVGLLVAIGFAFTVIGMAGEAVALLALLGLVARGLASLGHRAAKRSRA